MDDFSQHRLGRAAPAYRGDFAARDADAILPIITQVFLWTAVFEAVGSGSSTARLAGYSLDDMIAYYLLSMLARAFSSMPGLASTIAKQIREGEVKKYIVQPIDLIGFMLLGRAAHKIAYYTVATLPFALVFYLCRGYFASGWPSSEILIAFVLSYVLGFLLGFFMDLCIGLVGFWFLEVGSLLFIYMLLNFFLSGHMFPLDLLSEPWKTIVDWLPFKYMAYFPAAIFLGKIPAEQLWWQVGTEALWLLGLIGLSRVLYSRGLKRYSGYGG
ncbi:MAG: ABC-2 family transporter protein [Pirellulaceae bacterium]